MLCCLVNGFLQNHVLCIKMGKWHLHTFIIWALIIFINFMMGPDNYLVNDLLISNFGPRGHWTLQLLERREIVHTKWSIHTYEHVTWPTICEGDPAPPPDWLGSLDSFPQEHLTMFSPMTVPFTPQIALVADSLLENLQQIIFFFHMHRCCHRLLVQFSNL